MGTTVLHYSVRFGYTACVEELLQHPSIDTSIIIANLLSPMTHVFSQSSIACIDALLRIGDRHTCSRDFFGKGILHSLLGVVVSLEYLLSTTLFHLNVRDQNGYTLLMSSLFPFSRVSFFYLLNELNILLTAQTFSGYTVLYPHLLLLSTSTETIALAKRAPVLVNVQTKTGVTPLHLTAQHYHSFYLKWLLFCSTLLVNIEDENGETPLRTAVKSQRDDNVRALLTREDVDVNACDHEGRTPLHYAMMKPIKERIL